MSNRDHQHFQIIVVIVAAITALYWALNTQ
jgi:hypothetical protein